MLADNYLRCDSSGSCMMGDNLTMLGANGAGVRKMADNLATKDNGFGISASVPGMGNIGMQFADNSLVCDADGSCMLKDSLAKTKENNFAHVMYMEEDIIHPITIVNPVKHHATATGASTQTREQKTSDVIAD